MAQEPADKDPDDEVKAPEAAETETKAPKRRAAPTKRAAAGTSVKTRHVTLGSATAGVGTGTIFAMLASSLQDANQRAFLVGIAPAITMFVNSAWLVAQGWIIEQARHWQADSSYKSAKKAIEEALANPQIDEETRQGFQQELVDLDQMRVKYRMSHAASKIKSD